MNRCGYDRNSEIHSAKASGTWMAVKILELEVCRMETLQHAERQKARHQVDVIAADAARRPGAREWDEMSCFVPEFRYYFLFMRGGKHDEVHRLFLMITDRKAGVKMKVACGHIFKKPVRALRGVLIRVGLPGQKHLFEVFFCGGQAEREGWQRRRKTTDRPQHSTACYPYQRSCRAAAAACRPPTLLSEGQQQRRKERLDVQKCPRSS